MRTNITAESRDVENSFPMMFGHLDLAIPEATILNYQPTNFPFYSKPA